MIAMREERKNSDWAIARGLHSLGGCLLQMGRLGEAESVFHRAIGLSPRDDFLAMMLAHLGRSFLEAGWPAKAEPLLRRVLKIRRMDSEADVQKMNQLVHEVVQCVQQVRRKPVAWGWQSAGSTTPPASATSATPTRMPPVRRENGARKSRVVLRALFR